MQAVLGIDAAWTAYNPSGVALAVECPEGWSVAAAASSYAQFTSLKGEQTTSRHILETAERKAGRPVAMIAVDMPMSRNAVTGRRVSDKRVSSVYGSRKCATHSPSAQRPGPISDRLRGDFEALGFPLLTQTVSSPGLAEVYPHPALVELTGAAERLPYKVSRARLYWPGLAPAERKRKLIRVWRGIVKCLEAELQGVAAGLPAVSASSTGRELKAFEDTLDAIICCWIGICILEGRAIAHGDDLSSIWIPDGTRINR